MLMSDGTYKRVWWQPHEDIWLRAANTLRGRERQYALNDIAKMTSRRITAVEYRAYVLRMKDREAARALLVADFHERREAARSIRENGLAQERVQV